MKKILAIAVLASIAAASVQAQGLLVFSSSTQNVSTNNAAAIPGLGGSGTGRTLGAGQYVYALYVSASATTVNGSAAAVAGNPGSAYVWNDANWTLTGIYGLSTATAGRWASTSADSNGANAISGIAGGSTAQFVVVAWNVALGSTIAQLQASLATPGTVGFIGQSAVSGALTLGNGALIPTPNLSGATSPQIPGWTLGSFQVAAVPEPSTLALAGLGGLALLAFRRRK